MGFTNNPDGVATEIFVGVISSPNTSFSPLSVDSSAETIRMGVTVGARVGVGVREGVRVHVDVGIGVVVFVGVAVGTGVDVGVGPVIAMVASVDQTEAELQLGVYLPTLNKYSPGPA